MTKESRQRLRLLQNLSRELARQAEQQPALIDIIELHDKVKRGEVADLSLMDKKRLYVAQYALVTTYFIAAPDVAMIKIGKTVNLAKRLAAIQSHCPVQLQVACEIDYDDGLEGRIHKHLKEYRSHGEWFHAEKEVVDFMRGYRDNGIRWVVDKVGDSAGLWMNNRGKMPEDMRDDIDRLGRGSDPDLRPNTQNVSGIDFSGCIE